MRADHPVGTLLFLVGPPGSGKSTLAKAFETHFDSTAVLRAGDCWRKIAAGEGRFASAVEGAMRRQEPIPPRVFTLAHRLFFRRHRTQRVLVDGNPYSTAQVEQVLEAYRSQCGHAPRALVAILNVSDDECLRRMRERGRSDDEEANMRQRLAIYHLQQRSVVEAAVRQGLVSDPIMLGADPIETIRNAIWS